MQRVSGQKFQDYVQREVLDPLGMTSSTFAQPLPKALNDRLVSTVPFEFIPDAPAGAMSSTAADMGRFMNFVLGGEGPLSRTSVETMLRPALGADRLGTLAEGPRASLGFLDRGRNGGALPAAQPTAAAHAALAEGAYVSSRQLRSTFGKVILLSAQATLTAQPDGTIKADIPGTLGRAGHHGGAVQAVRPARRTGRARLPGGLAPPAPAGQRERRHAARVAGHHPGRGSRPGRRAVAPVALAPDPDGAPGARAGLLHLVRADHEPAEPGYHLVEPRAYARPSRGEEEVST
ncbi:hypothetical protein GCM10018965_090370 [Nonomuraea roseola]